MSEPADRGSVANAADGRRREGHASGDLVISPRRVKRVVVPIAVGLVVVFAVVAVLLRNSSTGVRFGASDQVSLALVGLVLAAAVLCLARPRVRADAEGVDVRNLLFGHRYPWSLVRAVSFPDGAPWARLELPDDEYVPVVAVQAADGVLAVRAVRELRALHRTATEQPIPGAASPEAGSPEVASPAGEPSAVESPRQNG